MFDGIMVVESAVSAFNNAALWGPAFMWWALLALPLFVVVFMCGGYLARRVGFCRENMQSRMAMWVSLLILLWVIMFGGNYGVLRDGISVLPMMNAVIVFLGALFVSSYLRDVVWNGKKWQKWLLGASVLLAVGLSDVHTWWGPLLQICAFCVGAVLGRFARGQMRPIAGTVLIMLMTVTAILMQPEFYRFGQLGNLTAVHLLAVLMFGVVAMALVVVANVSARARIRDGVFFKLRWLMRVMCALGGALFLLTEAVPVFLGLLVCVAGLFAMSVWHAQSINGVLVDKLFAMLLMVFGVITVMPVITCMGILYWVNTPQINFWREIRALL